MAKWGRYQDAEDRKKNASSEGDAGFVLLGLVLCSPFVVMGSQWLSGDLKQIDSTSYITSEQIAESQIQSEQAAYQNEMRRTVTDCSSAMDALSRHEQTGAIGISSNEYVNRQVQLINLNDTFCRVPNQKVTPPNQITIIRRSRR